MMSAKRRGSSSGLRSRARGRKAGTGEFNYSDGLKSSGLTWGEGSFREYIKDPRAKSPDTRMMFVGIKDDAEIGELWAYLK
jgi:cytochrome c